VNLDKELCRIFIDEDDQPAFILGNPFKAGGIGIKGSCYLKNLRISSLDT
jgi:hypothetical protein